MLLDSILNLKHSNIICDVSGVIFDEVSCFEKVNETFEKLISQNRNIILLSNAPRKEDFLREKLQKTGFKFYNTFQILTAGMFFLEYATSNFKKGVKYCTVGKGENSLLDGNFFEKTSIELAEICIIYYMDYEEPYIHDIKKIVNSNMPVYCINPDVKVETPNGVRFCAGKTAKIIESEGGMVKYFGKPYLEIFEFLQTKYKFEKEKTLLVGDSMLTDILGAKNFGIESLLVLGGIHRSILHSNGDIKALFSQFNFKPNFVIDYLK